MERKGLRTIKGETRGRERKRQRVTDSGETDRMWRQRAIGRRINAERQSEKEGRRLEIWTS
jgi:hypothetical protein